MESPTVSFIYSLILFTSLGFQNSNGQSYSLQMYHKFSNEVKEWMTWRHGLDTDGWPVEGSNEYYKALYHHDSARHGRKLADHPSLTFLEGNETVEIPQLGFLFYSMVQVGTPNVTLFVALDTGSDVFWVPCDCQACAPTSAASYGLVCIPFSAFPVKPIRITLMF
uniref:Peptidase A1 domain-containing protein n=1 Tax=Picea sitchensis TaxID=3332 RepID=D5A9P2_PICSI|nr:unknown [Picea sitchensis]